MIIVITGGSGSGKSEHAENKASELSDGKKYYLATMKIYGEEGIKKVERHRRLREGKGFYTLEYSEDIYRAADEICEDSTVLIECMSNLLANEMYRDYGLSSELNPPSQNDEKANSADIVDKIIGDVRCLSRKAKNLVIVTNNVSEDGELYDEETLRYIDNLGRINARLFEMADLAYESVVGILIPVAERINKVYLL